MARETPQFPQGVQQEMDKAAVFPKSLPLRVWLAAWQQEEMGRGQSKTTPLECMVKNFKRGFNGDYGVKSTLNKLKFLCEVDWTAFDVGWSPEGSLNKTVFNEVYRVIEKTPNTQEYRKSQES
jgi:hypothetical protein